MFVDVCKSKYVCEPIFHAHEAVAVECRRGTRINNGNNTNDDNDGNNNDTVLLRHRASLEGRLVRGRLHC